VIPAQQIIEWSEQHQAELHLVNSDHRLGSEIALLRFLFGNFLKL